jgi:hypothetical protein
MPTVWLSSLPVLNDSFTIFITVFVFRFPSAFLIFTSSIRSASVGPKLTILASSLLTNPLAFSLLLPVFSSNQALFSSFHPFSAGLSSFTRYFYGFTPFSSRIGLSAKFTFALLKRIYLLEFDLLELLHLFFDKSGFYIATALSFHF